MTNLMQMLKQAQDMQGKMTQMQERLEAATFEGVAARIWCAST